MFGIGKPKDVRLEFYDKSKVSFIFSFKSQSLTIAQVDEVFNDLNKLLSTEIRKHLIHGDLSRQAEKIVDKQSLFELPQSRDQISVGNPYHYCCPPNDIQLTLAPESAERLLKTNMIDKVSKWDNFRSLYVINSGYYAAQVSTQEEFYKRNDIPIKGLAFKKERFGNIKEIDTQKNPAPSQVIKDTWLCIGWKMWLKNDFFANLTGKKLSGFTDNYALEDDGQITSIQLYQNQNEPHFLENIERQKAFKKWIQFEKIIQEDRSR